MVCFFASNLFEGSTLRQVENHREMASPHRQTGEGFSCPWSLGGTELDPDGSRLPHFSASSMARLNVIS